MQDEDAVPSQLPGPRGLQSCRHDSLRLNSVVLYQLVIGEKLRESSKATYDVVRAVAPDRLRDQVSLLEMRGVIPDTRNGR